MPGKLAALGASFAAAFGAMNDVAEGLRHVAPLPPGVSTITLTGTLDVSGLPVEQMRLAAELAEELGAPLAFVVDDEGAAGKRRRPGGGAGAKRFRSQLPLRRNGKSLKLFHNGSVHATGCGSPAEFLDMADALTGFVADVSNVRARLLDFDVQLINVLFLATDPATGRPLTIAPAALLRTLGLPRAEFDTERHPSVKVPLLVDGAKAATVCVFQTGSVSIMGAKRPEHVAAAYEMVCTALDRAAAEGVCAPDSARARATAARQPLVLVDGYPFGLYFCCLGF